MRWNTSPNGEIRWIGLHKLLMRYIKDILQPNPNHAPLKGGDDSHVKDFIDP